MNDRIACAVCGQCMKVITPGHLNRHHMTTEQYRSQFGEIRSERSKQLRSEQIRRHARNPRKMSEAGVASLRESIKRCHTPESRAKMAASNTGRKHSEQARQNMSKGRLNAWLTNPAPFQTKNMYSHGKSGHIETRFGCMFYRSSWECRFIEWMMAREDVSELKSEPVAISYEWQGKRRGYRPDFLVTFTSGVRWLVEIKPTWKIRTDAKTREKIKVGAQYAEQHHFQWLLLTENELNENLKSRAP